MVGYRHSVPPDKWWDWLGRDRTRDEVDPWDEQHAWLEDEFGWVGEQLAALTGSEDEDEDKDKRTTRLVWYEDDEGELENTVTWGKREKEARTKKTRTRDGYIAWKRKERRSKNGNKRNTNELWRLPG